MKAHNSNAENRPNASEMAAVVVALDDRIDEQAQELVTILSQDVPSQDQLNTSVLGLALSFMAQEPLLPEERAVNVHRARPAWIVAARSRLTGIMERDSSNASDKLAKTIFFIGDIWSERAFDDVISGSVKPSGSYEDVDFAKGVLSGEVTAQPALEGESQ
jgi:hypothetical protein